jgi:2-dehydropantoate 2-reductase
MRIAIYGTGGAGGYLGAQLARSGEDVTFLARGEHLKAIQAHGLRVETPAGEIVIQPAKATDDLTQVAPVDVVLLGVKACRWGRLPEICSPWSAQQHSWCRCRTELRRHRN